MATKSKKLADFFHKSCFGYLEVSPELIGKFTWLCEVICHRLSVNLKRCNKCSKILCPPWIYKNQNKKGNYHDKMIITSQEVLRYSCNNPLLSIHNWNKNLKWSNIIWLWEIDTLFFLFLAKVGCYTEPIYRYRYPKQDLRKKSAILFDFVALVPDFRDLTFNLEKITKRGSPWNLNMSLFNFSHVLVNNFRNTHCSLKCFITFFLCLSYTLHIWYMCLSE